MCPQNDIVNPNPLKLHAPGLFGHSLRDGEPISCDIVQRKDGVQFAINVAGPREDLPENSPNNYWVVGNQVQGSEVGFIIQHY